MIRCLEILVNEISLKFNFLIDVMTIIYHLPLFSLINFFSIFFQLSEMTAELGDERSAATLATERLEVEQSERMKLQKDHSELQVGVVLCRNYT